ncbi:MAG: tyrosine-type recombinase/integrase [Armatimonadota bacterium]
MKQLRTSSTPMSASVQIASPTSERKRMQKEHAGKRQGFICRLGRLLIRKGSASGNERGNQSQARMALASTKTTELHMPALENAITAFMNRCIALNLAANTMAFYHYRFEAFRKFLCGKGQIITLEQITPSLIREFIASEKVRVSEGTAKRSFVTVRAFCNFIVAEGMIQENPTANIKPPKICRKIIPTFSPEQSVAMLKASGNGFYGSRNRAMIFVLYDCGLRASELCGIRLADINWSKQNIRITGKGNKERDVCFGAKTRTALESFLLERKHITGSEYLFITRVGLAMDRHGVVRALKSCGKRAGITGVRISPHTFRHTCALTYVRNGGDVFSLQKLLGHSGLEMTRRYTELAQSDISEKHRRYSPGDTLNTE